MSNHANSLSRGATRVRIAFSHRWWRLLDTLSEPLLDLDDRFE